MTSEKYGTKSNEIYEVVKPSSLWFRHSNGDDKRNLFPVGTKVRLIGGEGRPLGWHDIEGYVTVCRESVEREFLGIERDCLSDSMWANLVDWEKI